MFRNYPSGEEAGPELRKAREEQDHYLNRFTRIGEVASKREYLTGLSRSRTPDSTGYLAGFHRSDQY